MNGRPANGITGFGVVSVSGRSRVPSPPARTSACTRQASTADRRPADALVGEAGCAQRLVVEEVPPVHDERVAHQVLHRPRPVELAELRPLGDEHGGVGARRAPPRRYLAMRSRRRACSSAVRARPGRRRARVAPSPSRRWASTSAVASRTSSVFGLNATPSSAISLLDERAEVLLELADRAPLLQLVHLDHRRQQLEVVAGVAGELLERRDVLREAGAAVADARAQELRPDPLVEAHAARDLLDVGAQLLGHVRDLVDERDLRGEEGVRGELDHLGARRRRCARSARRAARTAPRRGRRSRPTRRPRPTTTRSGCMKSSTAAPSLRNSGHET